MSFEMAEFFRSFKKEFREHPIVSIAIIVIASQSIVERYERHEEKLVYEMTRQILVSQIDVEMNRLNMEEGHMIAYKESGHANSFQLRRLEQIPQEKNILKDKRIIIERAQFPEPLISVARD